MPVDPDIDRPESDDRGRLSFGDRLRSAFLKPPKAGREHELTEWDQELTVEELQDAVDSANDFERLLGLLAAPIGGMVTLFVIQQLISNAQTAIATGVASTSHASIGTYHELEIVDLALTLAILSFAWWRKRLFLAISLALFGLSIFNLHFYGFGIPFILAGAWMLIRSYRLSRALREANAGNAPRRSAFGKRGGGFGSPTGPGANKRYTPPSSRSKR